MRRLAAGLLRRLGMLRAGRGAYRFLAGRSADAAWRLRGHLVGGGLPVPPPHLCFRAAASYDVPHFLATGRLGADSVRALLDGAGRPLSGFRRLLDLGCGCGRILRHLPGEGPEVTGADIDAEAVRWCSGRLDGRFAQNDLGQPLPFDPGRFDLVIAVAVVCHLSLRHQRGLLEEMARVLSPGGVGLVTLKGRSRRDEVPPRLIPRFDSGRPAVVEPELSGSRYCLAYHPHGALKGLLPPAIRLLRRVPLGSRDTGQDACILLRR
jgi:SAM-dependent methyltransferase